MGNRYRALRRSGNIFDQKDFSESTNRSSKNNPHKKVSPITVSKKPASRPKFTRYNTSFSRLLKLFFDMSEREQLRLLEYAKSIIDERTLPRSPCLIPVDCTVEEQTYDGLILDINSCGAYIDTDEPFPVGQKIGLDFFNPFSQQDIQLGGKIIRSSSNGIGVSFYDWSRVHYIW